MAIGGDSFFSVSAAFHAFSSRGPFIKTLEELRTLSGDRL